MEQFLVFAMLYERMLENTARRDRHMTREAQPLEPILWHRMDELTAGRQACAKEEAALDDARCRDWTTRQSLVCGSRA